MTPTQRKAVIAARARRLRERMNAGPASLVELTEILMPDTDEHPMAVHREIAADLQKWAQQAAEIRHERLLAEKRAAATAAAQSISISIMRDAPRPGLVAQTDDEIRTDYRNGLIDEAIAPLRNLGVTRSPVFSTYLDVARAMLDRSHPAPEAVIECLDPSHLRALQRARAIELRARCESDRQAASAATTEFAYLPKAWRLSDESLRKFIADSALRG